MQMFQTNELCTVQKPIKTDRKLLQQLLNAATGTYNLVLIARLERAPPRQWHSRREWERKSQFESSSIDRGSTPIHVMVWAIEQTWSQVLVRRFCRKGKGLLGRWGIVPLCYGSHGPLGEMTFWGHLSRLAPGWCSMHRGSQWRIIVICRWRNVTFVCSKASETWK